MSFSRSFVGTFFRPAWRFKIGYLVFIIRLQLILITAVILLLIRRNARLFCTLLKFILLPGKLVFVLISGQLILNDAIVFGQL